MSATSQHPERQEYVDPDGAARDQRTGERNRLLCALPRDEYAWLLPHLEPLRIESEQCLAESGTELTHVYFPRTAIVSLLRRMRDGTLIECGTIGPEGMAGLPVLGNDAWSPTILSGQAPGLCARMPFVALHDALPTLPVLHELLRRASIAYVDQLEQTLACNTLHALEPRCARWLLVTRDQLGDAFVLTLEVLGQMLVVGPAGVTTVIGAFEQMGLITYDQGHLHVLDPARLEAIACECYQVLHMNFDRRLGRIVATQ